MTDGWGIQQWPTSPITIRQNKINYTIRAIARALNTLNAHVNRELVASLGFNGTFSKIRQHCDFKKYSLVTG